MVIPLLMMVSVVLFIPGVFLAIAAAFPAYYVHAKKLAWDLRDQAPDENRNGDRPPRPWE